MAVTHDYHASAAAAAAVGAAVAHYVRGTSAAAGTGYRSVAAWTAMWHWPGRCSVSATSCCAMKATSP